MTLRWYRSTNAGRTWEPVEVKPRSVLVAALRDLRPGEVYDDVFGNLYRYEAVTQ